MLTFKRLISLTFAVAALVSASAAVSTAVPVWSDDDHKLSSLWSRYEKASEADLPVDQLSILDEIKKEAKKRNFAWDYYDACDKCASVRSRVNWKDRTAAYEQRDSELVAFGAPVIRIFSSQDNADACETLIGTQRELLLASRNPEFYSRDRHIKSKVYAPALISLIRNDYEYALWQLWCRIDHCTNPSSCGAIDSRIGTSPAEPSGTDPGSAEPSRATELIDICSGRYPLDAFLEYDLIPAAGADGELVPTETSATTDIVSAREKALQTFAAAYESKAVSLMARQDLIDLYFSRLSPSRNSESDFLRIKTLCEGFEALKARFESGTGPARSEDFVNPLGTTGASGAGSSAVPAWETEAAIASCCTRPAAILGQMQRPAISFKVWDGVLTAYLTNLPAAEIIISSCSAPVGRTRIKNPSPRFYVSDTLSCTISVPEDGDYRIECRSGDVASEQEYHKYSLSLATRPSEGRIGVYVADSRDGKPLSRCDLSLSDSDGSVLCSASGFALDGFTGLPEQFQKTIASSKRGCYLQASVPAGVRRSERHFVYYRGDQQPSEPVTAERCVILTDCSAFTPGDTVHFKIIPYRDKAGELSMLPEGSEMKVSLASPDGSELVSATLRLGEFGSAAGEFPLGKCTGGLYSIRVADKERTIGSVYIRVDEFVLPSFDLVWDEQDRKYYAGDSVRFSGTLRAFSGHSLGSAKISYFLSGSAVDKDSGELTPGSDGRFVLSFPTKSPGSAKWYYGYAAIQLAVTDVTGETLQFSNSLDLMGTPDLNVEFLNASKGNSALCLPAARDMKPLALSAGNDVQAAIICSDTVRFRLYCNRADLSHAGTSISWSLEALPDGTAASGTLEDGGTVTADLSGLPDGLYVLRGRATARLDNGVELSDGHSEYLLKLSEGTGVLPSGVKDFFLELPGNEPVVRAAVGGEPVWAVAELSGEGRVLASRKLILSKDIQTISFKRRDAFSGDLQLSLMYFRDNDAVSHSSFREPADQAAELPLRFTRFLDTVSPSRSCTFTIAAEPGAECAAAVFDIATEKIRDNVWNGPWRSRNTVQPLQYSRTIGRDCTESFFMEDAIPFMLRTADYKTGSNAVLSQESGPEDAGTLVRENFAAVLAWEPFLRIGKDSTVSFAFRTSDRLSTFAVQLFAHDKSMSSAVMRGEMKVTVPIKVSVVQPQFLYNGDSYCAAVSLASSVGRDVAGKLSVCFYNGADRDASREMRADATSMTVPAGATAGWTSSIVVPEAADTLGMLVRFTPDSPEDASDAIFLTVPVKRPVQLITESHSAVLLPRADRDSLERSLRSEFINIDGSLAKESEISILAMLGEALPKLAESSSDNAVSLSEAICANAMLRRLGRAGGDVQALADKLLRCSCPDGGFAWFEGMGSSAPVTALVLERAGAEKELADLLGPDVLSAAVSFLDSRFLAAYASAGAASRYGIDLAQYLHVRAMYPEQTFSLPGGSAGRRFRKDVRSCLTPSGDRRLGGQLLAKARRINTIELLTSSPQGCELAARWGLPGERKMKESARMERNSLRQYAVPHEGGGRYFPNAVLPWRGLLASELYAHVMLCRVFASEPLADELRLWMMLQKETQQWGSDPAYIEALDCVFRGGEDVLSTSVLELSASAGMPFGSVKPAGNGMSLECGWYRAAAGGDPVKLAAGDSLHVGDRLVARYRIHSDENRSFVRLTAPRPASFRPVNQLSGYSRGAYRTVRGDRSEYWMETCPEEDCLFEEEFFVTQQGCFRSAVPVVECLYAPHYRANTYSENSYICFQ